MHLGHVRDDELVAEALRVGERDDVSVPLHTEARRPEVERVGRADPPDDGVHHPGAGAAGSGYDVHVYYLWLPSADLAVARVQRRVALGGHSVPEDVIRRRYERSLRNMRQLMLTGVTTWRMYDASAVGSPRLVAFGAASGSPTVVAPARWVDRLVAALTVDAAGDARLRADLSRAGWKLRQGPAAKGSGGSPAPLP